MNPTQNRDPQTEDQQRDQPVRRPEGEEPAFTGAENTRHRTTPPGTGEDFSQGDEPAGDNFIGDGDGEDIVRGPGSGQRDTSGAL